MIVAQRKRDVRKTLEQIDTGLVDGRGRWLLAILPSADQFSEQAQVRSKMQIGRGQRAVPQIAVVVGWALTPVVVMVPLIAEARFATQSEIGITGFIQGNVFERLPPGAAAGVRIGQIGVVLIVSRRGERRRGRLAR